VVLLRAQICVIPEPALGQSARLSATLVYYRCMTRTNIDVDDNACRIVMERYHLSTKREAVNFALRTVAAEPLDLGRARALRGSGWEGDLDDLRAYRVR